MDIDGFALGALRPAGDGQPAHDCRPRVDAPLPPSVPDPKGPFPYAGPGVMHAPIVRALRQVIDPEVALNIVDVGLVCGVTVTDDTVRVTLTMTSAACPVTDVILADAETELDRVLPKTMAIDLDLVWEPAWTPDRMSPRARRFMGW